MPDNKHRKKDTPPPPANEPPPGADDGQAAGEPVIMISKAEYDHLKAEVEAQKLKALEYFEGLQRERADFVNYKKRIEREQAQARESITASVVKKYLAVLDDLERALRSRPASGEGAAWAEGIEFICRKLQGILEAEGIQRIPAEGQAFDPAMHEAILQEDNPAFQSGQVTEILQQGYTLGDRVIRPAQVKVAR